jgi:hypothetical protein
VLTDEFTGRSSQNLTCALVDIRELTAAVERIEPVVDTLEDPFEFVF